MFPARLAYGGLRLCHGPSLARGDRKASRTGVRRVRHHDRKRGLGSRDGSARTQHETERQSEEDDGA
jgi:hypothetical protein